MLSHVSLKRWEVFCFGFWETLEMDARTTQQLQRRNKFQWEDNGGGASGRAAASCPDDPSLIPLGIGLLSISGATIKQGLHGGATGSPLKMFGCASFLLLKVIKTYRWATLWSAGLASSDPGSNPAFDFRISDKTCMFFFLTSSTR